VATVILSLAAAVAVGGTAVGGTAVGWGVAVGGTGVGFGVGVGVAAGRQALNTILTATTMAINVQNLPFTFSSLGHSTQFPCCILRGTHPRNE
jgi:hypothetical protein